MHHFDFHDLVPVRHSRRLALAGGLAIGLGAATVSTLPSVAFAQDECALIENVIDSSLDPKNPFGKIVGLTLMNADECEIESADNVNYFRCYWNVTRRAYLEELEELEEEEHKLYVEYLEHEGGDDARDEAEEYIKKANYWIRTYNKAIAMFPNPNHAQWVRIKEFRAKAERYKRQARAIENEIPALEQEKEQLEAKYGSKKAEVKKLKNEINELAKNLEHKIFVDVNDCFKRGAISDGTLYRSNLTKKIWKKEGGCEISISRGPELQFSCPILR